MKLTFYSMSRKKLEHQAFIGRQAVGRGLSPFFFLLVLLKALDDIKTMQKLQEDSKHTRYVEQKTINRY